MNNLAVILESGEVAEKEFAHSKELFLRAVERDANPKNYTISLFF